MTSNDLTARLAEMLAANQQTDGAILDSEDRAAEGLPARDPVLAAHIASDPDPVSPPPAVPDFGSPTREQAAESSWLYYGRGPTGRLRNFRAMNDIKLRDTYETCLRENNDTEAISAAGYEGRVRGLWS